jgi:hypothetical protein
VTRNAVSYEMAFAGVFRAMGAAMPADFTTVYAGEQPDTPLYPASFVPSYELWTPMSAGQSTCGRYAQRTNGSTRS